MFYKTSNEEIDAPFDSDFQKKVIRKQPLSEDVKNHLLATSEFGQDIQSDIDLYETKWRLYEASFR